MVQSGDPRSRETLCIGPWCKTLNQVDYEEGGGENDLVMDLLHTLEIMKIGYYSDGWPIG